MIDIKSFREYISELVYTTNQELEHKIDNIILAVNESHMVKKNSEQIGYIIMCELS